MALVLADRVQQTGTANTTISFTLNGSVAGFQSFSVVGNTNTTYYSAFDASGNWETGLGTYSTTGPTLTRTTVYQSSNSNAAVTFSGTVNVFVTYPAGRNISLDASGNSTALGTVSSGTWQGTAVGVSYGGTGLTSTPANGTLDIGNGTNFTRATLTAGNNITITNGSGSITIAASGGTSWQSVQSASFSATAGYGYPVNTTSASVTATLPASPTAGQTITFVDYAGTWATNNFIIDPNGNKFNGIGVPATVATNREGIGIVYVDATQGWVPFSGFNTSTPAQTYSVQSLVIAGGGGGTYGDSGGGSGGAGGYRCSVPGETSGGGGGAESPLTVTAGTSYTVTVGAGGSNGRSAGSGNDSVFASITSTGGGRGIVNSGGGSGGSGGGASSTNGTSYGGGSGTGGQGYNGGGSQGSNPFPTGGGGGAGGAGNGGGGGQSGNGGAGQTSSINGTATLRAGGGGGGATAQGAAAGAGGSSNTAGGGAGGSSGSGGTSGTDNTGGGGGGGANNSGNGGNGGSGIVIIRYLSSSQRGTGGTVTTSGGYYIHTFTSSGTYVA
jgi:hypothetical protein